MATSHTHVYHGAPVGAIDGSNKTFTFPSSFQTGTVRVFLRGLEQRKNDDYVENSSLPGIVMTDAPLTDDTIWVHYIGA